MDSSHHAVAGAEHSSYTSTSCCSIDIKGNPENSCIFSRKPCRQLHIGTTPGDKEDGGAEFKGRLFSGCNVCTTRRGVCLGKLHVAGVVTLMHYQYCCSSCHVIVLLFTWCKHASPWIKEMRQGKRASSVDAAFPATAVVWISNLCQEWWLRAVGMFVTTAARGQHTLGSLDAQIHMKSIDWQGSTASLELYCWYEYA